MTRIATEIASLNQAQIHGVGGRSPGLEGSRIRSCINIADRGEHIVEDDLLAALESGQLAGAALDVFGIEPLSPTHPFWGHPKIVVTPHAACDASVSAVADTLVATADAIRKGERPPHAIDRGRGY